MASEVLALLNRDESFHTLRLRAKAKMCANDQLICHEEYCPYARDYYAKLLGTRLVPRLLAAETHLVPDAVFETARDAEVCPFEVSLELAHQSQVVIGDYNYAFEPNGQTSASRAAANTASGTRWVSAASSRGTSFVPRSLA